MPSELIRYPFTEAGLREALEALGTTADAVATNLLAMGFRGDREECDTCPVAKYLWVSIEGIQLVDVNQDRIRIGDSAEAFEVGGGDIREPDDTITVGTPSPVTEFIQRFDHGQFEDLDLRVARDA